MSYTWANAEQTTLIRQDDQGDVAFVPADPGNRDYAEFLASGATAADYVEPPAPVDARTSTQKLEDATGLTIAEILEALGL